MVMMKVSVLCSSTAHPIYPRLEQWVRCAETGHEVELVRKKDELTGGDVLFLISCHEIISLEDRQKYGTTLVIHGRSSRERIGSLCP
jgi:methionyl-tRNA formyltransferase